MKAIEDVIEIAWKYPNLQRAAFLELAQLKDDLSTARKAMTESIGYAGARPGCECPICKWLADHPQRGEA